jgi:hypothetical protein
MTRSRDGRIGREGAEAMAVEALGWLAADKERLGRFLALTGLGPESLRAAAAEPGFLARVLDHLGGSERDLLAFAAERGHPPQRVAGARLALGGEDRAWAVGEG